MSAETIRLLLVDDHPAVRQGLGEELEAEDDIDVVGLAGSVAEAVTLTMQTRPEIILTDMHLPDGSGAEVCRQMRARESHARILIYTGFDEDCDLWNALRAGADGFIYKSADLLEVAQAVRQIMTGKRLWTGEQEARAQLWWDEVGSKLAALTGREREVLRLVALGLTDKEIARELDITRPTVRFHLLQVSEKLGLRGRVKLVTWALEHGLLTSKEQVDAT